MKLDLKPGKYVLAVSGGVDSMVLLDLLSKADDLDIVVAHFNHGIRTDSGKDEKLVAFTAKKLKLPIKIGYGKLGPDTSEAVARQARYKFLEEVRRTHKATAIVIAHHQDDLLETATINLIRGTGWRGLVAIIHSPRRVRPMLNVPKKDIVKYAKVHNLKWHEDSTNADTNYLRNQIRLEVLPKLKPAERQRLLKIIWQLADDAPRLNRTLKQLSHSVKTKNQIDRRRFADLPSGAADELLLSWLKQAGAAETDRKLVSRLSNAIKAAPARSRHNAGSNLWLEVSGKTAQLVHAN